MSRHFPSDTFTVLIVDDEPKNIQLLGNLLRENQYHVEFATNGEDAIEWLRTSRFDLVLLDITMPGMDGYDVCRKIKSYSAIAHIPVIFLTARSESEDIVRGFEAGGSDYITKPFNKAELLARVKVHVELKTLRGLIPICAHCKSVRDDKGIWERIEVYIEKHSLALFTHGLCPECMEKLYGNEPWMKKRS